MKNSYITQLNFIYALFGYLPSGLQERALICSSLWLWRKSTRVHRVPAPLERVPKYEAVPDLTDATFPG